MILINIVIFYVPVSTKLVLSNAHIFYDAHCAFASREQHVLRGCGRVVIIRVLDPRSVFNTYRNTLVWIIVSSIRSLYIMPYSFRAFRATLWKCLRKSPARAELLYVAVGCGDCVDITWHFSPASPECVNHRTKFTGPLSLIEFQPRRGNRRTVSFARRLQCYCYSTISWFKYRLRSWRCGGSAWRWHRLHGPRDTSCTHDCATK